MAKKDNKDDVFSQHAAAVARELLGEPNKQLSRGTELRFGNGGSLSVDTANGKIYDHQEKDGGGVLWLIERETGQTVEGGKAVQWMRDRGYYIPDQSPPPDSSYQQYDGGGEGRSSGGNKPSAGRYDDAGNYLPQRVPDHGKLTAVYDYVDAAGTLIYQVVRFDWDDPEHPKGHAKTFCQRVPDSSRKDGFSYSVKGKVPSLPYRLPELLEDIADGAEIFLVEGEKKVDLMRDQGIPATCNTGGAGKFPEELLSHFKGANVTILPDNDLQTLNSRTGEPLFHEDGRPKHAGQDHAEQVGNKLTGIAKRVRLLNLPNLPPSGGVDDWFPAGGTVQELYQLAKLAPIWNPTKYLSKFGAVGWLDMDAPGPQHEWLIKKVLTRGEVSMLAGASQSGKTFLALDQTMAIVQGIDWFGHKVLQGGAVYCASESAVGVRRKRLAAYRKHYGIGNQPLPFTLLQRPIDLYNSDEHAELLVEELKHFQREYERQFEVKLEHIVIDTLSAVTPGWDENSSRDVGPVLARCGYIRDETGAHVQLVHHLNAEGTKARGHTSIFANIENVMIVRKVENSHDANKRLIREMVITKQKEEVDGEAFKFVLPAVQIGTDEDGDRITSCIIARPAGHAGEAPPSPVGATVGGKTSVVLRVVYELMRDHMASTAAPAELGLAAGARMVKREDITTKFLEADRPEGYATLSEEDQKKAGDASRQALKRGRDLLFAKGIISYHDEWCCLTGKPVAGFREPPGTRSRQQQKAEEAATDASDRKATLAAAFGEGEDFDPGSF